MTKVKRGRYEHIVMSKKMTDMRTDNQEYLNKVAEAWEAYSAFLASIYREEK